jgi:O-acetyl-ADP-ribose deacetylase (regulator of RNase III)
VIEIVQANITTLDVDAIVNAANSSLLGGGGVDGAIHRAAGPELARAAGALAPCATGRAVMTPGFRLRARFVIHAVGPVWQGGGKDEAALLRQAYETAFALARGDRAIRSIAFPAISTGIYGFPKDRAASIALSAMLAHEHEFERVIACVFDRENLVLYEQTIGQLRART